MKCLENHSKVVVYQLFKLDVSGDGLTKIISPAPVMINLTGMCSFSGRVNAVLVRSENLWNLG